MIEERLQALESRMASLHRDMQGLDEEMSLLKAASMGHDDAIGRLDSKLDTVVEHQRKNHSRLEHIEAKLTGASSVAFIVVYVIMKYLGV